MLFPLEELADDDAPRREHLPELVNNHTHSHKLWLPWPQLLKLLFLGTHPLHPRKTKQLLVQGGWVWGSPDQVLRHWFWEILEGSRCHVAKYLIKPRESESFFFSNYECPNSLQILGPHVSLREYVV
jgi:hypothetical protein